MWEPLKTSQIATKMRRYNLAVLGISETHWTQAGQERLNTGEILLYSCNEKENAPLTQRVALMLSKVARSALVGRESYGSRIIKESFKTKKGITKNIIQCYAPTNDSKDNITDQFYEWLQSIIENCPRKDLTILIGDLNAEVGIDNTRYEDIMGRYGLERETKMGKICNSVFIQQIGHRRHNISTQTLNELKIAFSNSFQALQYLLNEEEFNMEDNRKDIKEALTSTSQDVLGLKKCHHKEWISIETLDKIKERKNKKAAINNSRT
ncbi:unnamed protein product [Schistosoma margrebowiei]|uniref:Uncharacterized protein n=1 Tax=Schistosoma margrebowiei TaxID=48269 RepID=A0A183N7C1_9TREM|nr:unnamed protein product [Schistosoma margrebowiei]